MSKIAKDDFMTMAAILIEDHFPKGVATERGQAMVLIAELLKFLIEHDVVEG